MAKNVLFFRIGEFLIWRNCRNNVWRNHMHAAARHKLPGRPEHVHTWTCDSASYNYGDVRSLKQLRDVFRSLGGPVLGGVLAYLRTFFRWVLVLPSWLLLLRVCVHNNPLNSLVSPLDLFSGEKNHCTCALLEVQARLSSRKWYAYTCGRPARHTRAVYYWRTFNFAI